MRFQLKTFHHEVRLRTAAIERRQPLPRVRQRVVFDRFLTRVLQILGDRAVINGGVALELRLEHFKADILKAWSRDKIEERAKLLADLAIRVWPAPPIRNDALGDFRSANVRIWRQATRSPRS